MGEDEYLMGVGIAYRGTFEVLMEIVTLGFVYKGLRGTGSLSKSLHA